MRYELVEGRHSRFWELQLRVSHHQFSLEDSEHLGQSFRFDHLDDGLEVQRHGVVVHLRRAAGAIPVVVEVRGEAPEDDLGAFHLVSEGSFESPSGELEVASPEDTWAGGIHVPPGWLRVQVRQAELDTSSYDGDNGADHYRVILWPAPQAKTRVLHSRQAKDEVLFKPRSDLAQLEAALASGDQTARCLAVCEAVRHLWAGEEKALPLLARAAQDPSPAVRSVRVSALGLAAEHQRRAVLALVQAQSEDAAEEVRARVPEALCRLGSADGAQGLLQLMAGADRPLALAAAQRLWMVAEHVEVGQLLPLLASARAGTRAAALTAVGALGESSGWESVAPAAAAVRTLANDKDRPVRELAASLMEKLGAPVAELLKLARSRDAEQRVSAALALGKSGAPEALQPLLALLDHDRQCTVQRSAAEGLGLLGDRRAVPHLGKHLQDGTLNLNWYAAAALAQLGGTAATRLLWRCASQADSDERFEYIGREATDRLADMLRARARLQAGEPRHPGSPSPEIDGSVVQVPVLLDSPDDRLCQRGLKLLEHTTEVEAVAAALARPSAAVVEQALRTLREMVSAQPSSSSLRVRAARAVRAHAAALDRLPDPRQRVAWLELLYWIGGPLALAGALAAVGEADPEVRSQAASVLGQVGPDRALEVLAGLLKDPSPRVANAAARALGFCTLQRARAQGVLTEFLTTVRGSARAAAESSLEQLSGR